MRLLVDNLNLSLRVVQTAFIVLGFWTPTALKGYKSILFHFYTLFSLFYLNGSYIIIQVGYICQVWGNVPLMTEAMFLLFTNLSVSIKVSNVYWRQKVIQEMISEANTELSAENKPERLCIINRVNRKTTLQLYMYFLLAYAAVSGWAVSAEKGKLLVSAWYPYDATKSPAYELSYTHQVTALFFAAGLNICLDTLVTSLISQCQCRLSLLSLSLRTLCDGLKITEKGLLSPEAEVHFTHRLRRCIKRHEAILNQVAQLQNYFSIPILAQFSVSVLIICVTAYLMARSSENVMWLISMMAYMAVMLMQVFIYCYHGNQLVVESGQVACAVYDCPWYTCSPAQRRCLLLMMVRAQRESRLKPWNLTEVSLVTFMAIVKASYTFFTVLRRAEDGPNK